jgi:hypothetical protein
VLLEHQRVFIHQEAKHSTLSYFFFFLLCSFDGGCLVYQDDEVELPTSKGYLQSASHPQKEPLQSPLLFFTFSSLLYLTRFFIVPLNFITQHSIPHIIRTDATDNKTKQNKTKQNVFTHLHLNHSQIKLISPQSLSYPTKNNVQRQ